MSRILGARRLSHDTDASTSTERQGDAITGWSAAHNHTVVYMTDDTDVSGAVAPFDRGDLGPWLKPPKLGQWDILAVAKLDRISRSLVDFADFLKWCEANGKTLVSVAESLDFGTPTGQFIGKILILFAEWERETMRARRADASRKIAANAGWHGGHSTEWGYRPVERDGRWALEPDPDQVPAVREIVDAILNGESGQSVADRYGTDHTNLLRRLRRPSLYGLVVFKGEVVRGPDGMPVMREPVIERRTWDRLQARLDANSAGKGVPRDASPWLGVIYCGLCGDKFYFQRYTNRPNTYYAHKPHLKIYRSGAKEFCPASCQGHAVESQINGLIMRAWVGRYAVETIEIPGEDHTGELRQVQEAIEDLQVDRYERGLFRGDAGARRYAEIMSRLEARQEAIIDAGVITEPATDTVETGELLTDLWLRQPDDHAKGALLRKMGYRIYVRPDGPGKARIRLRQIRNDDTRPWTEVVGELDDFDRLG